MGYPTAFWFSPWWAFYISMFAYYIWTFYTEILVVSTVLTCLHTQDCHYSAIQNSQGEFVSIDSYPDYRTLFQLIYWALYLCHLVHSLIACTMVHWRRKCSIFSSSSPHSWHLVSTWFWLNRALLACKMYCPLMTFNFIGILFASLVDTVLI